MVKPNHSNSVLRPSSVASCTPALISGDNGWIRPSFGITPNWHSALGRSPFEVLYGYAPRHFGIATSADTPITDLATWLSNRALMTDVIHQHLNRAKQRMKRQADEHRLERQFQIGDLVFVKIQPYVQSSLAQRSDQKLAFKFFGPYRILARVASIAYRLELPASSSVHHVFHVSQLKKSVVLAILSSIICLLMQYSGVFPKRFFRLDPSSRVRALFLKA